MRSYVITGLTCLALGVLAGVVSYKRLNPPKPCPQAEEAKTHVEEKTIYRYVEGKPVEKEVVRTNIVERKSAPLPPERRPNMLGVQAMPDGKGGLKVGVKYGRELFPNLYLEGGVVVSPKGEPKPAITAGVSVRF